MAKLSDYEFRKLGQQALDFKDDVRDILNYGKVQFPIVNAVPAWKTNDGEMCFFTATAVTDRRIYVRLDSGWSLFSQVFGNGNPSSPGGTEGSVQYNSGGIFGGMSGGVPGHFIFDTSASSLDLYGHLAVGNSARINSFPLSAALYPTDTVGSGTANQLAVFQELLTDNRPGQTHGILLALGLQSGGSIGNGDTVFGGQFHISCPGLMSGSHAQITALMASVSMNSYGSGGAAGIVYGLHSVVQVSSGVNPSSVRPYGLVVESQWKDLPGNQQGHITALFIDRDVGLPSLGGHHGVVIGPHNATSAGKNDFRYNLVSLAGTDAYKDAVNYFQGPLMFSPISAPAKGSLHIRNDNSSMQSTGSGTMTVYAGSATATGTNGNFFADFTPGASATLRPSDEGIFVEIGTGLLLISSVNAAGTITLKEPSNFTAVTAAFVVKKPSIIINGDGPDIDANSSTYPFVVCQGLGRVGINDPQPTQALSVKGNILATGNIISAGLTTIVQGTTTRPVGVLFAVTALGVSSNSTTENELIRGIVGTTSLLANTLSEGRTIRLKAWGYYNTQLVPDTLRMSVLLGTTTIMSTGAQTPAGSVSTGGWELKADITCQTTGGAGTVFGQGDFPHFTSAAVFLNWEMVNSSAITVNTTGANPIRILAQWGGANAANQIYCTNAIGEILN